VGVRPVRVILAWLTVLACLPALSGCVGTPASATALSGDLTVLAPTSLTDVMPVLVYRFTTVHGGIHITTSFGPDVRPTAPPGDVLLTEGTTAASGATGPPATFAVDQFVLAVPLGDPKAVGQVADLARPGLRVARCGPAQPCGRYADAVLAAAGVTLSGPLLADDVRSAIGLVVHGQADVAMVYRTDAQQFQDTITAVEFPESSETLARFQAATLTRASNPAAAKAFVDFLLTGPAQDALSGHFFQLP
jgi:molybdate transport system substrate-binding protein